MKRAGGVASASVWLAAELLSACALSACVVACARRSPTTDASPPPPELRDAAASVSPASAAPERLALAKPPPPALRVLGLRVEPKSDDAGAPKLTVDGRAIEAGARVEGGEKLAVTGAGVATLKSVVSGSELEVRAPATLRLLADDTLVLYDGALTVSSTPRGPVEVATAESFVSATPGTRVEAGSKGTVIAPPAKGTASVWTGAAWEALLLSERFRELPLPSADAAVSRCRTFAQAARTAWESAALGEDDASARPRPVAIVHVGARARARTACASARAAAGTAAPAQTPNLLAGIEAADDLWQRLDTGRATSR